VQETTQSLPAAAPALQLGAALRAMPFSYAALGLVLVNFLQPGSHDAQRAYQMLFLLAFALLLALGPRAAGPANTAAAPARWLLGGFFVLGCASALASWAPRYAFYEVSSFFLLLLLGLAIAAEIARDAAANTLRLLQALGVVCVVYALRILAVYALGLATQVQPGALDLTPNFSNYRFFNHVQTVTLPLLVLLSVLAPRASRVRWVWFALAAFWWAMVGVTAARGTLFGELAGCAGIALLGRRHGLRFVRAMALTALAGAALYLVFFMLLPALAGMGAFGEFSGVVERTVADPASGRERLWRRAFELIAAHPWLGVGPQHFAHYAADVHIGAHPHNWALQVAVEWGLPALCCLVTAIACGARGLLRAGRRIAAADDSNQMVFAAFAATGLAILADGLLSGLIVMPQSQLAIVIYLGCAVGWSAARKPSPAPAPRASGAAVLLARIVLVAAACGVAAVAWPELGARLRHEPLSTEAATLNGRILWPRLWQAGYF
jgi:O-antigen ligase